MQKMFANNILQRYVIREWFQTFWPSFLCFEILMFLGFVIQILHKGLDIIALKALIPHMFIQVAPYSIPSALLTATTLTYGRLSADREIIAIQASGVHLRKIITPVLVIGIIFSFFTLVLSAEILPRSLYQIKLLQERAINNILAGRLATFQKKVLMEPYQIYIGNVVDNVNKDITVIQYADDYVTDIILAEEGSIEVNNEKHTIFLTLRKGEFIKPNYKKAEDVPRLGVFAETTFEIPMGKGKTDFSTKHMTIFQLFKYNNEIDRELANSKEIPANFEEARAEASRKLAEHQNQLQQLNKKQKHLESELKKSKQNLERQKSKIDGLANESKLANNYILVATENLMQLKRENKAGYYIADDIDVKLLEIKETIEREKQRINLISQRMIETREIQNSETHNIATLSKSLEETEKDISVLLRKITSFESDLTVALKKKLRRKNDISIHKRISQALSCLSFIVIGIPLGIKLRSSHLIIGFGVSFMIILFIYYPLMVTGSVLADDTLLPVVPVLWGANGILLIGGICIYQKLFAYNKS
ncbi:LptF/LptG family permease [Candidatus Kuenenia sp.]|uniref:LptF/LptG family permease n=1 Tax=Candidatus Kuenenia sp. TaxID=2499824 RepID=UPI00321FA990